VVVLSIPLVHSEVWRCSKCKWQVAIDFCHTNGLWTNWTAVVL